MGSLRSKRCVGRRVRLSGSRLRRPCAAARPAPKTRCIQIYSTCSRCAVVARATASARARPTLFLREASADFYSRALRLPAPGGGRGAATPTGVRPRPARLSRHVTRQLSRRGSHINFRTLQYSSRPCPTSPRQQALARVWSGVRPTYSGRPRPNPKSRERHPLRGHARAAPRAPDDAPGVVRRALRAARAGAQETREGGEDESGGI